MTNFFRVVRKKKVGGEAVSKGATEPKSNTVDFLMDNKPTECAGVWNSFQGPRKKGVKYYCEHIALSSAKYHVGVYSGLPAIVST